MSNYDSLTGLPNRTLFFQTLRDAIELAQDKNWRIAVLFITLDRFKIVNDSLGPALGDELLRQFSTRLVRCVRLRDTVGRLGGDEFALILTMTREQTEEEAVQRRQRGARGAARAVRPERPAGRADGQHRHRHVPGRRRSIRARWSSTPTWRWCAPRRRGATATASSPPA